MPVLDDFSGFEFEDLMEAVFQTEPAFSLRRRDRCATGDTGSVCVGCSIRIRGFTLASWLAVCWLI
jgi:hypothetical protein